MLSAVTSEALSFIYDDEGQTETVTGATTNTVYDFDAAHRLVGYTTASQTLGYQYDGAGNRLSATRNGTTTQYIHDAGGNLIAEANSSGTITRYYIHGLGLMAFVDAATNQLYVYHHDGTGHTIAVTNSSGDIVNRYAYAAFGKLMAKEEAISQPFTYAGQAGIYTEADNLYYMKARYYDAEIGRFISEDPSGFAGGLNQYAYAGGNPISFIDPSGLGAEGGGFGAAALNFGLGFIPGYDLYKAISNPDSTWVDIGLGAMSVLPGGGKALAVLGKGGRAIAKKVGSAGVNRTGKNFTTKTKKALDSNNAARNGGVNKCENCGTQVVPGKKSQQGVTPPGNERQRDHIIPKSKGGDGTYENGQILCRTCNLNKRDN